jgi:mRNA-degrading endonuclease RelE of RelBE toxin-antitoxin system
MTIEYSKDYLRTLKRITKKRTLPSELIDSTIDMYLTNHSDVRLQFKHISCKRDKNRHSIRIPNTQYRILMSIIDNITLLVCICDHDDYDYRNKNC